MAAGRSGPWVIPIAGLLRGHGRQEETRQATMSELRVVSSVVAAGSQIRVELVLDPVVGGVEVSGTVAGPWHGECRRCLAAVGGELRCEVRELYLFDSAASEDTYQLSGDQLDLEPMVRDALALDLPVAPLCRPDCRGLCPACGADLNSTQCSCSPPPDPRWAALEGLDRPPLS
jgi:uncharacterized protein